MTPQELKKLCDDCASYANSGKESVSSSWMPSGCMNLNGRCGLALIQEALELLNKLEQLDAPSEADLRVRNASNPLLQNADGRFLSRHQKPVRQ